MKIFPAIDLYEGKAVRLLKGDYEQMTIYSEQPLAVAHDFEAAGADCLHLVDLEGARLGTTPNLALVTKLAQETSLFTEIGGGIRSKALYKDHSETIMGNMDSIVFLGGSEPTTLKDLAEALGKETIDSYNNSDTRGNSPSYGTNYQKLGHELMSRDELAVLDGGKCILQLRGVRPFLSDKYDLTQHPNYKMTSDADPKNALDIEKYLSHREKIHPDDQFVLVDVDSLPPA